MNVPVRRFTGRQTPSAIQKQKVEAREKLILSRCQKGLTIANFSSKGRGIVTTTTFSKGDFVVEYIGELITKKEKMARSKKYSTAESYIFDFDCDGKKYVIDATPESDRFGRLVNHSRKEANLTPRSVNVKGVPHLFLEAKRKIVTGEEICYDYADHNPDTENANPWLRT